ncbi:MAG: hypothetical protein RLZZ490_1529, partial [Cyanobacteriota bacterium]
MSLILLGTISLGLILINLWNFLDQGLIVGDRLHVSLIFHADKPPNPRLDLGASIPQ